MATNPTAMPTTMSPGTTSRSLTILNPPVSEKRQQKKYPPKIGALKSKLLIRSKVYFELLPWPRSNKCPGITSKPSRFWSIEKYTGHCVQCYQRRDGEGQAIVHVETGHACL